LEGGRELHFGNRDVLPDVCHQLEHGGREILIFGQVLIDCLGRAPGHRKDGDALCAARIGLVPIGSEIEGLDGRHQLGGDVDVGLVGVEWDWLELFPEDPSQSLR
jgi:hypothetical protein